MPRYVRGRKEGSARRSALNPEADHQRTDQTHLKQGGSRTALALECISSAKPPHWRNRACFAGSYAALALCMLSFLAVPAHAMTEAWIPIQNGTLVPTWHWGYRFFDPERPLNRYACTSDPGGHYCPDCGLIGGFPCEGVQCTTCKNTCQKFGGRWDGAPDTKNLLWTGWEGVEHAATCLPVGEAVSACCCACVIHAWVLAG